MEDHNMIIMNRNKTIPKLLALVLLFIISVTLLRPILINPATYKQSMEYLDEKMNTATTLSVGTASASLLVSLLPEDAGSSIADEMANFTGYLLLIVSVIFLERYLITVLGFVATGMIFPLSTILGAIAVLSSEETKIKFREYSIRMLIFGICLLQIIPVGCLCGRAIEEANSASIQMALNATKEADEIVQELPDEENKNIFGQVGDFFSGLWNSAVEGYEWAKTTLKNFMSAIAVMLVTTIGIPVLILFSFIWIIKFLTKRDFSITIIKFANDFTKNTKRQLRSIPTKKILKKEQE